MTPCRVVVYQHIEISELGRASLDRKVSLTRYFFIFFRIQMITVGSPSFSLAGLGAFAYSVLHKDALVLGMGATLGRSILAGKAVVFFLIHYCWRMVI